MDRFELVDGEPEDLDDVLDDVDAVVDLDLDGLELDLDFPFREEEEPDEVFLAAARLVAVLVVDFLLVAFLVVLRLVDIIASLLSVQGVFVLACLLP